LGQGIACDPFGCTGRLSDGARIAYALTADAFADDCWEARGLSLPRARRRRQALRR
jgi:hypothetical protein